MASERHLFFIVNPHADHGQTAGYWANFEEILDKSGKAFGFELTGFPGHATELSRAALKNGFRKIVAVGGDGTVNEVLNGFYQYGKLIQAGAVLGHLPSGTGSDLARSLGCTKQSTAIDDLYDASPVSLDHGLAVFRDAKGHETTRFFMNEASVGFTANVAKTVNRSGKRLGGKASFFSGVLKCLVNLRNPQLTVSVDNETWYEGPVFAVVIANGKYFAGSMLVAPDANLDDGFFDVVLIKDFTRFNVLRHIGKVYKGTHIDLPQVMMKRGRAVSISSNEPTSLEMDGEQPGTLAAYFQIVEKGVRFLTPPDSPKS